MYKYLILLVLASCGDVGIKYNPKPTKNVFMVNGLVVVPDEYALSPQMVEEVLIQVENVIRSKYDIIFELEELIKEEGLSVIMVKAEYMPNDRGIYYDNEITNMKSNMILVRVPTNENEAENCVDAYYVMGHEIIHFVEHKFLCDYMDVEACDHLFPNLFVDWAYKNKVSPMMTAEFWLYDYIKDLCGLEE